MPQRLLAVPKLAFEVDYLRSQLGTLFPQS